MIYPYHCVICDKNIDIIKPVALCAQEEICIQCGIVMDRVYTPANFNFMVISEGDKKSQALARDRGSELIPVGDERPTVASKLDNYELPAEVTSKFEG